MRFNSELQRLDEVKGASRPNHLAASRRPNPEIPDDLRDWLHEPELARLVEAAVHKCSIEHSGSFGQPAQVLLGMMTYSYATGMFFSDEIEAALARSGRELLVDGEIRSPSRSIRQFRRHHRELVEACLFAVLCAAFQCAPAGTAISLETLKDEARRRVIRAVQYDSWALDF